MKVCFIGHRTIEKNKELISTLEDTIIQLINKGVTTFLFGSRSEFDSLSWEVVTKLKEKYPFIIRVYVRSAFQHVNKDYEEYLLTFYEKTYYPSKLASGGKFSYVKRNADMIDQSNFCIFYYNENYLPLPKGNSGTKIAYKYALKKNKQIINLYK